MSGNGNSIDGSCLPLVDFPPENARILVGLLFDIDDTFTYQGKIISSAYQSLWKLRDHGLKLAAVTGRSAGWCDHMARLWPVDAVIGENGGFYFFMDQDNQVLVKHFMDDEETRALQRRQLQSILKEILNKVPNASPASDQPYRETDIGIDCSEDVSKLSEAEVTKIIDIFERNKAKATISSIHINGHLGKHNKLATTIIMARNLWGIDLAVNPHSFAFCGDSANDETMFRHFPLSFGVRNIQNFYSLMTYLPAFVAEKEGGHGFQEIAEIILQGRSQVHHDLCAFPRKLALPSRR
jgi:HAD superfamily hydrolase (TIGR01484 family)